MSKFMHNTYDDATATAIPQVFSKNSPAKKLFFCELKKFVRVGFLTTMSENNKKVLLAGANT